MFFMPNRKMPNPPMIPNTKLVKLVMSILSE
jgi:hypothetical protein